MASGHVNRTQRPNTWLHRPSLRREDSPCQLGAVHTWPITTDIAPQLNVRFRRQGRHRVKDHPRTYLFQRHPLDICPYSSYLIIRGLYTILTYPRWSQPSKFLPIWRLGAIET